MGMKQQAKKENHFDLTCVALVLFTRWLLKGTTHKAPESSTSPGWGGHTGQPELCWLTGGKCSSHCPRSTAPSSPSIPQGSAILTSSGNAALVYSHGQVRDASAHTRGRGCHSDPSHVPGSRERAQGLASGTQPHTG